MTSDEMSKKFKKALIIAVNVGCGFEADAEDAAELLTLIVGLESRIAELEEKQRWIPVSERMPEDGEHVLAAYVDTMLTAAYYRHHIAFGGVDNWWDVGEGWHTGNPTHWMPLPQLPEVK